MSNGPVLHFADPRFPRQPRQICAGRATNNYNGAQMTRNAEHVTCKRCLAKMPKPATS